MSDNRSFEANEAVFERQQRRIAELEAENALLRIGMEDIEADQLTIAALANRVLERLQAQRSHIDQLEHERNIDHKTGLLNMRGIQEAYDKLQLSGRRRKGDIPESDSMLFIDVDKFNKINEKYGHLNGDNVIFRLAGLFKDRLRQQDIVGRFGGDEFIAILPQTRLDAAASVADSLRAQARSSIFDELGVGASLSIGVGLVEPGVELGGAIEQANKAMYQAKQSGRDQIVVVQQLGYRQQSSTI